jgi:hypothetical protein
MFSDQDSHIRERAQGFYERLDFGGVDGATGDYAQVGERRRSTQALAGREAFEYAGKNLAVVIIESTERDVLDVLEGGGREGEEGCSLEKRVEVFPIESHCPEVREECKEEEKGMRLCRMNAEIEDRTKGGKLLFPHRVLDLGRDIQAAKDEGVALVSWQSRLSDAGRMSSSVQ